MNDLIHQRCFHHSEREAVARCPECRRFFCRECITEHEDRVLCSSCLMNSYAKPSWQLKPIRFILVSFEWIMGLLMAWLFFYALGRILLLLPDAFHDGTLWQSPWWMEP